MPDEKPMTAIIPAAHIGIGALTVLVSVATGTSCLTGCKMMEPRDHPLQYDLIERTADMSLPESDAADGQVDLFSEASSSSVGRTRTDDNGIPIDGEDDDREGEKKDEHPDGEGDKERQDGDGQAQKPEDRDADGDGADGSQPSEPAEPAPAEDRPSDGGDLSSVVTSEMMRDNFLHGPLPADKAKYIVLHDTESGTDDAAAIARSWGDGHIAAHFVVGKDGTVIQCVPIDQIAHHAGNADYGSNGDYGIWAERDDEVGRTGEGDYAMNAWSIGIEMVHEHDDGAYPEEQLRAVDRLIAAIDNELGRKPTIIDHKAWAGNRKEDVSDDFPLHAYQMSRRHDG